LLQILSTCRKGTRWRVVVKSKIPGAFSGVQQMREIRENSPLVLLR
jgi:hypothetical protein